MVGVVVNRVNYSIFLNSAFSSVLIVQRSLSASESRKKIIHSNSCKRDLQILSIAKKILIVLQFVRKKKLSFFLSKVR